MGKLDKLLAQAKAGETTRGTQVWKPSKKGDAVSGVILKMRRIPGKGRDEETGARIKYLSLTLGQEDGSRVVVNCGMLLTEDLADQDAAPGDSVAIVYQGKETTGGGNEVSLYTMALEKADNPKPAPKK